MKFLWFLPFFPLLHFCMELQNLKLEKGGRQDFPWTGVSFPQTNPVDFVPPAMPRDLVAPGDWKEHGGDCLILENHLDKTRNGDLSNEEEDDILYNQPREGQDRSKFGVCGTTKYDGDRIVGGKTATIHSLPWIAALKLNFRQQFCGGSLISDYYILTAAHCIAWGRGALKVTIHLGDHNLKKKGESSSVTRRVRKLKMHKSYDAGTTDYDVALIEMDRPIKFREHIRPICLTDSKRDLSGELALVSGWGHLYMNGPSSQVLKAVNVTVISERQCQKKYGKTQVTKRMICAGEKRGGKDACQGDSGGPLIARTAEENRWNQIGIVSWGRGCALARFPGVYTKVSYFLDWIRRHSVPSKD